jgi:hypothetical protein
LARDLGKTVQQLDRMPGIELIQWMAFYRLEYEAREEQKANIRKEKETKTKADRVNFLKAKFKTQIGAYNKKVKGK